MPTATIDDLRRADRILCYGVTGSGKSTAAVKLGELLDLPVHLVDDEVGWLPGWMARPVEDQRRIAAEIAAGKRWVIDSAYGTWRDLIMEHTQVILALDYGRWLTLWRLLRRTVSRVVTRTEICNGNVETLAKVVTKDSIIRWHFRSYGRKHERMVAWEAATDGIPVFRVTHPRQLDAVMNHLRNAR